jgi:hypothetical protein
LGWRRLLVTDEEEVRECLQPNGNLYSLGWYLDWRKGAKEATLDGDFTAGHLRVIANIMDGKDE